jgi:DNA-binding transcriptional LysR family regulator
MEMRQLRYFVAVGEEQHYGRAAERLRVAQPALSRQIQNLENEISFKVFDRLPRSGKITDAGKFFSLPRHRAVAQRSLRALLILITNDLHTIFRQSNRHLS